jgi:hypothetical protein
VRHENIDNHQVEARAFKGAKSGFTAFGNGYPKVVPFEIDLDRHADHWIVVDDENTWHIGSPGLTVGFRKF